MSLHLDIRFQAPPHLAAAIGTPSSKSIEGTRSLIFEVAQAAINDALEAGFFAAGGCLTLTIQDTRKKP